MASPRLRAALVLLGILWICHADLLAAGPSTFTVNSTADEVDAAPGDGVCATAGGVCTLRAAIQETNALPGEDRIELPIGTYRITIPGAFDPSGAGGDLDITDDLVIDGAGPEATVVDGNQIDRAVAIQGMGQSVSIRGLTITNGRASPPGAGGIFNGSDLVLDEVVVTANTADFFGGGILNGIGASLRLINSAVMNNRAESPAGGGAGGGISGSGTLTITGGAVSGNWAGTVGGGIDLIGTVRLRGVRLLDNFAGFDGGGVRGGDGDLTIEDTTIQDNGAGMGDGGGVAYYGNNTADYKNPDAGGKLTITGSTVSGNFAGRNGGGIYSEGVDGQICVGDDPPGCVQPSRVSLTNTTLSGNDALGGGGGIFSYGEDRDGDRDCNPSLNECTDLSLVSLHNVTLTDNSAAEGRQLVSHNLSTLVLRNSLVMDTPLGGACSGSGILRSEGHNIASDHSCALSAAGDRQGTHVLLGALADNSGPTETHALLAGSPAIDAGDNAACPATDQRGVARPQDGDGDGTPVCDIGAYEFDGAPATSPTPSPSPIETPGPTPEAALPIRLPSTGGRAALGSR